jgi:hypothetical protein
LKVNSGLWIGLPGAVQQVARTGQPAPGTPPGVDFGKDMELVPGAGYLIDFADFALNQAGQLVFQAGLHGVGVDASNDEGIWIANAGGIRLLAREGDAAPGTAPGVVFARSIPVFDQFVQSETGRVVFLSGISGPGVDGSNRFGLWATDGLGNLILITRSGQKLDVGDGESRTIAHLTPYSFNTANEVGFEAEFTDGSNGVFIAVVPEPSSLALAVGLCVLAATCRYRGERQCRE